MQKLMLALLLSLTTPVWSDGGVDVTHPGQVASLSSIQAKIDSVSTAVMACLDSGKTHTACLCENERLIVDNPQRMKNGRAQWAVPVAFLAMLLIGGAMGIAGVALPIVEAGILASLLIVGLLITGTLRLPLLASTAIAAGVALLHGHAHGTEMPQALNAASYSLGFALSATLLLAGGIAAGVTLKKFSTTAAYRMAGGVIAVVGLGLAAS